MDLFVVNRYDGEEVPIKPDEQKNFGKILKKIEKRKQARLKKKGKHTTKKKEAIISVQNNLQTTSKTKKIEPTVAVNTETEITNKNDMQNVIPEHSKFNILGTTFMQQAKKVRRVLPDWLLNPIVVPADLTKIKNLTKIDSISEHFISENIRQKLSDNGLLYYFPIQSKVVPLICTSAFERESNVRPQDILVSAPTGSGKTLAYVIPLLQVIKNRPTHEIRVLVIAPTQKLATQIYETFNFFSKDLGVEVTLVVGGTPIENEQKQLVYFSDTWNILRKSDIVVCTPGRLVEHIKCTKGFNLSSLEYLVIDEADRVLDNIQDDWLHHLEKHVLDLLSKNKDYTDINTQTTEQGQKVCNLENTNNKFKAQRLLFSATLTQDPERLEKLHLFQPILITSADIDEPSDDENEIPTNRTTFVGKFTMPSQLKEKYIICETSDKPLLLYKYIEEVGLRRILIFAKSITNVHRLKILLRSFLPELSIKEISSTITVKKQKYTIKLFNDGKVDILVCTDSVARGIDLPNVQCVIQYDAPTMLKTYIHRVGRTARAGKKGLAVTFVESSSKEGFLSMLKPAKRMNIKEVKPHTDTLEVLFDKYSQALETLKDTLKQEEVKQQKRIQKQKDSQQAARMKYKRVKLIGNRNNPKKMKLNEKNSACKDEPRPTEINGNSNIEQEISKEE